MENKNLNENSPSYRVNWVETELAAKVKVMMPTKIYNDIIRFCEKENTSLS